MEQYARDLIHGSHANFEYDYHGRLFDWGERLVTDGVGQGCRGIGAGGVVDDHGVPRGGGEAADRRANSPTSTCHQHDGPLAIRLAHRSLSSKPRLTAGQSLRITEYIAESRATRFSSPAAYEPR